MSAGRFPELTPTEGILTHDYPTYFEGQACVGFMLEFMSGLRRVYVRFTSG